jgi:Putative motility protein
MSSISSAPVNQASNALPGSVGAAVAMRTLKKALDLEAAGAAALIQALPQPALATSGSVGTKVNTYA